MTSDQKPFTPANRFASVEFAMNPEPRCPCILLLDTSGSMGGEPIEMLNEGLLRFQDELRSDPLASKRVEVSIYTFGPVRKVVDFTGAGSFSAPELKAEGLTPMGEAITTALAALEERKNTYKANGISYYRPWIFLMTDGEPTDEVVEATRLIREAESRKAVAFFAVGVEDADMTALSALSTRAPLKLNGLKFTELFSWLSASLQRVSQSQVGQEVALPAVSGWASV